MTAPLAQLLTSAAAEAPDRVALVEARTGRRVTWAELDAEVDRVAAGFDGLGLVAGYRVVIALPNRVEFVTTYLGALRAGLVAVPVNPRSATGELVRLVADCGARVVVADAATVTIARQAVAGLEDALLAADEELRRSTAVPRLVVVDAPTVPGELPYGALLSATAPASPAQVTRRPVRASTSATRSGASAAAPVRSCARGAVTRVSLAHGGGPAGGTRVAL